MRDSRSTTARAFVFVAVLLAFVVVAISSAKKPNYTTTVKLDISSIKLTPPVTIKLAGTDCFPVLTNTFDRLSVQAYAKYLNVPSRAICIVDAQHNVHFLDNSNVGDPAIAGYSSSDYKLYLALTYVVDQYGTYYPPYNTVQRIAFSNAILIGKDGRSLVQPFAIGSYQPSNIPLGTIRSIQVDDFKPVLLAAPPKAPAKPINLVLPTHD